MTRTWLAGCVLGLSLVGMPAAGACKLALALGLDISSSVNSREYRLQLDGLANAISTPEVMQAILTPEGAHIVAAVYEWSGWQQQDVIIGWTRLDSEAAIKAFAARMNSHARSYAEFATAIGKAVEFGARLLRTAPPCARQVLDLSGDGANNEGTGPGYFRDAGALDGITINGLVIQGAYPDPAIYYREHVMQGPGAFVALARTFDDYQSVMIGKLLREIGTEMIVGDTR